MNKNSIDMEIRISDMAAMLLKAIKKIIVTTLIIALIGGVFGLYRSVDAGKNISSFEKKMNNAEQAVSVSAENLADAEKVLSDRKEVEIPQAEALISQSEELASSRQEYLDNSLYYAIDPFHCGVSRITIGFESEESGSEDSFSITVPALSRLLTNNSELLSDIQNIMKTDASISYIRELISFSSVSEGIVEISVVHVDPEIAEEAVDAIFSELQRYMNDVFHISPKIMNRFCGYETNWEMYDYQLLRKGDLISAEESLTQARSDLQRLKDGIPTLEKNVKELRVTLENDKSALRKAQKQYESSVFSVKNVVSRSLFYFLIMFFVGLLFSCFVVLLNNLFGGKLQNKNMILSGCKYPLLCVLPSQTPRLFNKTICKLEGESEAAYQSAVKAAAQTLLTLVGNRSTCFVSTLGKDAADNILALTGGRIPACGDIVNDSDAIKELSSFDSLILVEKRGLSRIAMIDNEIQRAEALGKEILGIVLT